MAGRRKKGIIPQEYSTQTLTAKEYVEILSSMDYGNKSDTDRIRFFLKQYNSSTIAAVEKQSIIERVYLNGVPIVVIVSDRIACPRGVESSFLYKKTTPIEDILSCLKFFFGNNSLGDNPLENKPERFFVFNKKQFGNNSLGNNSFGDFEMFLFDNLGYNKRETIGDQIIVSRKKEDNSQNERAVD